MSIFNLPVRAEPVEALSSFLGPIEGHGFDKLSPNGVTFG
jgi:hypothetical protein